MRRLELVGLSVITAALVLTAGCSDDEDNKSSGVSAPSEITKGVELNTSVTTNAMGAVLKTIINDLPDQAPARLISKRAKQIALSSGSSNSTITTPCEVSGSITVSNTTTESGDRDDKPEEGWTYEQHIDITYDNCVDNFSGVNFVGDALDEEFGNGTEQYVTYSEYNKDTNRSRDNFSSSTDYSIVQRSSTTEATVTRTFQDNFSGEMVTDGMNFGADDVNTSTNWTESGKSEFYHTDVNGNRVPGIGTRDESDLHATSEHIYTTAKSTSTLYINGFVASYETNSTGEHLIEGEYYNNYNIESIKIGDEEEITVSGTIGGSCLGGSVTVSVNPVIKSNDVLYPDLGPSNPALPYAGQATLTGSNTATVTFSVDSSDNTKTQATVKVNETQSVFTDWNTLATGKCMHN